jgi:two-component system LytT family response regulator
MEKLKAVIIEDEELGRALVKKYADQTNTIEIIAECENGFEGAKAINDLHPDMVFLDIQMPKLNGFEMLELIDTSNRPEIIFTTAYNQYAIQAFELNAIDYLLKPFSKERFFEAVEKAVGKIKSKSQTPFETTVSKLAQQPLTETLRTCSSKIKP